MKKLVVLFSIPLLLLACKSETKSEKHEEIVKQEIAYASFGDKITDENVISKSEAVEVYKNLKAGDTVSIKMMTKVNEVCQSKGCWMRLDLGDEEVMVKFKDYGFFMPKNIADKEVIVNGKAFISEVSVEEQRHYAEDAGKGADEIAAITEVEKTLSFEANGVLLKE
ncbi:MAG: DUF4920 domain-containing protein [Flavobacteriaceae bacterium]|nr:DUF4920 domain-containing protein [Flavobacteriaceae bacterium]